MKTQHPDLANLWSFLSGECSEEETRRHLLDCPECRQEARRWQSVFQKESERIQERLETMPAAYWRTLESGVRSAIEDRTPLDWAAAFRPAFASLLVLLLAGVMGWYGSQWTPIIPEQIDLAADLAGDFSGDSMEEQLWLEVDQIINQAPFGELSDLILGDSRLSEYADSASSSTMN